MRTRCLLALPFIAIAILPTAGWSQPTSIAVFSSNATKAVAEALAQDFEKANGVRVDFTFANSADVKDRIEKGAPFDVAILSAPTMDGLIAAGKLTPSSRTDIARAGVGIAVKASARRPDIS